MKSTPNPFLASLAIALATIVLVQSSARADIRTWDGTSSFLWSNPVNWDGDITIPGTADTATFGATGVGNVDLNTTVQTISALSFSVGAYTFSNGTLNLNTITNTNGGTGTDLISANVTDQGSAGLTINQSTTDNNNGVTINGQIAIANTGTTALQVVGSAQKQGFYTLGSTSSANSVAGGVSINSRLIAGVTLQGTWNITGNVQMINGASNDNNNGVTKLTGAINIGGNLVSAPTAGNSAAPCGIDIIASSDVRVTGNLLLQGPTTFAPSVRILQPLRLGGTITVANGVLGVSVTDPFLDLAGVADTTEVVSLGGIGGALNAAVSINVNNKTLTNPVTVLSGNPAQAILASTATGTGTGNKATFGGTVTLNKALSINASNTAGAILDVTGQITGAQPIAINATGALAGTVALSNAANSYSGTMVCSGLLQSNALGALGGAGRNVTVQAPGVVTLGYTPGTIQSDLLSRIVSTSNGAFVLTADSSENFDFSGAGNNFTALSLGAVGTRTYTGTLTPNGTTYRLGGGGGTLVFTPGGGTFDSTRDLVINGNGLTGTVDFGGFTKTFGAITIAGGTVQNGTLNCSSYSLLGGTVTATLNNGAGSSALTKTGSGTLTFSGTTAQTFTGGLIVNAGTVAENFANFTASPNDNLLDPTNVLTLGGGTLSLTGKNNVASLQTFASTTLSANSSSTITLARTGTGTMTIGLGAITRNTGSILRFSAAPDASTILASTATSNTNDILGTWAVVGAGGTGATALQYATVSGGQIIRYPDASAAVATPADLSNMTSATTNYSLAKPTGGTTLTGAVTANTLRVTSTSDNPIANNGSSITLNSLIGVGSNRTIISGAGNLVIGDTKELVIHWTVGFSGISCPIVDNPAGDSSVVINIPQNGEFDFQGAKSYTGGTTINAVEQLNFNVNSFGSGPITVNGSVRLSSRGTGSLVNNLTLNGPILTGGTYSGLISLVSTSSGNGATITGDMSGPGGFSVITAQTTFSGTNTYTGPTSITSGTAMFAKAASLYNAVAANWTPANISVNSGTTLRLAVGGTNEFTGAQVGTLVSNLTTGVNNNGLKAGSILYLDPRNAGGTPVEISSAITDSTGPGGGQVNLTIGQTDGSAPNQTVVLSGANTYSGKTTLDRYKNTTLSVSSFNSVSSPTASSSLGRPTTVANATINFGNGGDTSTGVLLYTGMGEITDRVLNSVSNTGHITLDQSGSNLLKFTGAITGGNSSRILTLQGSSTTGTGEIAGAIGQGIVTKTGTGTWTLSGSNTYAGITTVSQGVLLINGTNSGAGAVNVNGTATLGGRGTISSTTTIANNGKLAFTLSTVAINHDPLDITGTLVFSGASVLDITASGVLPAAGLYTLVTTTSGITGSAPAIVNLPSGWAATVMKSGDNKNLLLDVTSTGSGTTYATWAGTNADNQAANLDYDSDGMANGVEYFMGQTGSSFTANPVPNSSGKVTWPKDPAYNGTYQVQTSPDLSAWTNQASTDLGTSVEYTLTPGMGKLFVRLVVTPN